MNFARIFHARVQDEDRSVARSHVGRVRQINEDRTLDCPGHGLWAIADGMGGHFGGDVAAEMAISALRGVARDHITIDTIDAALSEANRAINARANAAHGVCGTTVVAALLVGETLHLCWAGDSRAYLIRHGRIELLTCDHTLVQELVDRGALTEAEARRHPNANVVTRALGVGGSVILDRRSVAVEQGDRVLLCSDGLSASLAPEDFTLPLPPLVQHADALLARALQRDGSDNISLVLVAIA